MKIAAKVDAVDKEYFASEIRPLLDHPLVDFVGEICDGEKEAFLGGAAALLLPIGWPEPFGLVAIEAMACGTPVIAYPFGSMPELIKPGVNGLLVATVEAGIAAVEAIGRLDRALCRRAFEERFTAPRMAKITSPFTSGSFTKLYRSIAGRRCKRQASPTRKRRWRLATTCRLTSTGLVSTDHHRFDGGGDRRSATRSGRDGQARTPAQDLGTEIRQAAPPSPFGETRRRTHCVAGVSASTGRIEEAAT